MNAEAAVHIDCGEGQTAVVKVPKAWSVLSFKSAVAALLDQHGAVRAECDYADEFSLLTPVGKLNVHVMGNWIATRFDDVALARSQVGFGQSLNPFTGKWNFHDDPKNRRRLCQCFAEALARLMALPSRS